MTRLLAGELIKVRTTRTAIGFGIAALLLTLAVVLISILAGDAVTIHDKRLGIDFGGAIAILLLVYGVVGATGEFRHRTVAPAVLIAPDRFRLVLARVCAYALTGTGLAFAMGMIAFAIGLALLPGEPGPQLGLGDFAAVGAGGLLTAALCTAIGVGAGTLLRNQVAAVVGVLMWIFVGESLLALADDDLLKYSVGTASTSLPQGGNADASALTAGLVLAAWAAVVCAAALLVDRRRDVD